MSEPPRSWLFGIVEDAFFAVTLRCRAIAQLQSRSLDEKLGWPTRIRMWIHERACLYCYRYHKQLLFMRGRIRDLVNHMDEPQAGPVLPPEAKEEMKRLLREENGSNGV